MSLSITLSGYDLSDEGPRRQVNEDATLVREDLGLFAVADGAGGRGRGDVAATLSVRTLENFVGATVREAYDRPDYDVLGNLEQAKRLSRAIHQANKNLLEASERVPARAGLASTIVALLLGPRTGHLHLAHVGDSRCYRVRQGRLELMTEDHSMASDVLECKPELSDEVLKQIPRNSVIRALGMGGDLRVSVKSLLLVPGDRFLLCSDGLSRALHFDRIWRVLRESDDKSQIASDLLAQALDADAHDNVSVVIVDCEEHAVHEDHPTRPYNDRPASYRPESLAYELTEDSDSEPPLSYRLGSEPDILPESLRRETFRESESQTYPDEPSGVDVTSALLGEPAIERPLRQHTSSLGYAVQKGRRDPLGDPIDDPYDDEDDFLELESVPPDPEK